MPAIVASSVQDAFWTVLLVVVIGGALVAVFTFLGTGKLYEQIGRGGLSLREDDDGRGGHGGGGGGPPNAAAATGERDEEIRQLVVARNERRARAGKEPLDVDAEIERQVRELSG